MSKSTRSGISVSFLNMKGGVGKTTLAVNVAWHMCRYGSKSVLLVDLDPQFNATQYIMSPESWDAHRKSPGTIADLLLSPTKPAMHLKKKRFAPVSPRKYLFEVNSKSKGSLHLLPSELVLAKAIKSPEGVPYKLEKALERIRADFDYIIIDCAPTDSVLTDTALMASDFVLIPMKPDRFSVLGYALMRETLDSFRETYPDPHRIEELGVVFTQVSGESEIEDQCMDEIEDQADYVFDAFIPRSVRSYSKSVQHRSPIFDTSYARQGTKDALRDVVREMTNRIDSIRRKAK